jgi:DNA-binding transcriptional ArsR family regulator
MVEYPQEARLDVAFGALSDPTRRAILARLARGPATLTELAAPIPMSLQAVKKHRDALEAAGLVSSRKVGRQRWSELRPDRLHEAADWLERYRAFWDERLDALTGFLAAQQEEKP